MKNLIFICITVLIIVLGVQKVNAKEATSFFDGDVYLAGSMTKDPQCTHLLGDPEDDGTISGTGTPSLAYSLQKALHIIKYVGIILCIVLTSVDFAKALFTNDKDMLKPLSKKAFSRLVYVVMLFFLPIIVKTLLSLIGAYGTCGIK